MNEQQNSPFATEKISKLILRFGVPSAVSLVVNALYNIVDQIFIGQGVGFLGNAATNVAFPVVTIAMALGIFIGDGAAAFYSLNLGAGDIKRAKNGVGNSYSMLIISGVLLSILAFLFMEPLLLMFGGTPDVMPYAIRYMRIIILGFPAVIMGVGLNSSIRADGSPKYAMAIMLLGAFVNTVLDPLFILKFKMGMEGAALATILGQYATMILGLIYLPRFKNVKFDKDAFKLRKSICTKICSLGTSSFISQAAIIAVMFVTNQLIVIYGAKSIYGSDIPMAVFGIAMKVYQILNATLLGLALGSQPIAGFNYGAKNYDRVRETFKTTVKISTICGIVAWVFFMFFPMQIISIFGSESALYNEFAVLSFRLHLPFCFITGFYVTSSILFQAIGKPKTATILSLAKQILLYIPVTFVMSLIFGIKGTLAGGAVADLITFIISFIFVSRELKELSRLNKGEGEIFNEENYNN